MVSHNQVNRRVSGLLSRRLRTSVVLFALVILSAVTARLVGNTQLAQLFALKITDLHFLLRPGRTDSRIMLITVDEKALGAWREPIAFWHPYYAKAIKAAASAGAKVLALDVVFTVPLEEYQDFRQHDRLLGAAALDAHPKMPVVCAIIPQMMKREDFSRIDINAFATQNGVAAFSNLTVDGDDFVRRQHLLESSDPDSIRSLAARAVEIYLGHEIRSEDNKLHLAGRQVHTVADREILINYAGPANHFDRVSLKTFVDAWDKGDRASLERWVKGKLVLLGHDTEYDRHATPYYTALAPPGDDMAGDEKATVTGRIANRSLWNTAGVEVHANAAHTLLSSSYLRYTPEWLALIGLLLSAAVTVISASFLRPAASSGAFLACVCLLSGISFAAFVNGTVLPTFQMVLASAFGLVAAQAHRAFRAERRGTFLHTAIEKYVGREAARSLSESEQISLRGSSQELTILFSDIRGFTAFCESREPEQIVECLNQYLSQMVDIILSCNGSVNKFIGDGILVIFSDHDGTEAGDHAQRAFDCGVKMIKAPSRFRTGVGIHTGTAVIGNIGSADKLEYTVLGETVNIASRLEGLNKVLQSSLLMSDETRRRLRADAQVVGLGAVPVRGLSIAMNLFTAEAVFDKTQVVESAD
jgi:adenylate cyclase